MNASPTSLNAVFDRLVVINLRTRTDRRRQMEAEFTKVGVPLEEVQFFAAIRPEDDGGFPSLGARGAYLSHLAVLRLAYEAAWPQVLVMEDDLVLSSDLNTALPALKAALDQYDWGIAYLGHMGTDPVSDQEPPASMQAPRWQITQRPQQCLHCYAVHQRALAPLIAYLEACLARPAGHPDGGLMHVDGALSMFRQRHPEVLTLLAQPSLGSQRPSRSDITHNRWYDRWPMVRWAVAVARQLKARLRS